MMDAGWNTLVVVVCLCSFMYHHHHCYLSVVSSITFIFVIITSVTQSHTSHTHQSTFVVFLNNPERTILETVCYHVELYLYYSMNLSPVTITVLLQVLTPRVFINYPLTVFQKHYLSLFY
jgi:hypothetical protein